MESISIESEGYSSEVGCLQISPMITSIITKHLKVTGIPKRSFLIFFQKLLLHSQTMMIKMAHTCSKIVLPKNTHLP